MPTNVTFQDGKYSSNEDNKRELDVHNITASDEGLYQCIPTPPSDKPTTDLFCLSVIGKCTNYVHI